MRSESMNMHKPDYVQGDIKMKRVRFFQVVALGCLFSGLIVQANETQTATKQPNVLLIAIDDLNDWIGCLGGHPQAKTPNIDRLAKRGVLFNNAHCQAPVCNPSRASMMSGLYPSTTGIYFLNPSLAKSPVIKKEKLLPQRYLQEGYYVTGAGKLFHANQDKAFFPNYGGDFGYFGPLPEKKISPFPGMKDWDWGAFPEKDELMPDYQLVSWAVERIHETHDKPLFLGVGFFRPHVPLFVPQKWFDMYPLETLELPAVVENDLDDLSEYAINITRLKHIAPKHEWVLEHKQWKPLVQSYLACISFVDQQVGKLLDALEQSRYKDNTYIVLYSDNGFHLGEKERWAKRSLWGESTRVPMIIAGPGIVAGKVCDKPAQLIDIYPTLLELTGLKADPKLEGHSLVPLLKNEKADWRYKARSCFGLGNVAIVSDTYRYIHYVDGSEEFYNYKKDMHEWENLINKPECASLIKEFRDEVPQNPHPILEAESTGFRSYKASMPK
jgi:arylsulfatase A-like enzyme